MSEERVIKTTDVVVSIDLEKAFEPAAERAEPTEPVEASAAADVATELAAPDEPPSEPQAAPERVVRGTIEPGSDVPSDMDRAIEAARGTTLAEMSALFSGGRTEPYEASEDETPVARDVTSRYPAGLIGGRVLPDGFDEEDDDDDDDDDVESDIASTSDGEVEAAATDSAVPAEGDEDESVNMDSESVDVSGGDIVYEVAVAAASIGKDFDGRAFAEYLEQAGPITDIRLSLAIGVLRLGSKLTGDRMLLVLEAIGFGGEAAAARIARDELGKIPDVPVEVMTALPAAMGES